MNQEVIRVIYGSNLFMDLLSVCFSQQAITAAVAINHMKKLQQAHSEQIGRQTSIPHIKVGDVSAPTRRHKHQDPDRLDPAEVKINVNVSGTNHMSLPTSPSDLKSHYHPLKTSQSQIGSHHTPTISKQGRLIYHSEPTSLNGFLSD